MDRFAVLRAEMVAEQLVARGIRDERVIEAMQKVPRHLFVPKNLESQAYTDQALNLGPGQSISQPYVVAIMLETLAPAPGQKILDVGTGSGYQTALLAELGAAVYSIEIDPVLSARSKKLLDQLGFEGIRVRAGDGKGGWPDAAPFDAVVVSAACDEVPRELVRQLGQGGKMILPLGDDYQYLTLIEKGPDGLKAKEMGAVQFVKLQ